MKLIGRKRKTKYASEDIDPDEIFLDSSNLPKFDVYQFEGRLERPIAKKTAYFSFLLFILVTLLFSFRAGILQIVRGKQYLEISENNHLRQTPVFSNRGNIYDRNEKLLAWNAVGGNSDYADRKYTNLSGFAHVLGYVNYPAKDKYGVYYRTEFTGKSGVEESYNETLKGSNGRKITEVNAVGETVSESVQKPRKDGQSIYLSVDSGIQNKFYEIIRATAEKVGFQAGAGILMNAKNGEIIALASYPEFDPNAMSSGEDVTLIGGLLSSSRKPFLNRVISGLYTPGSIVKPFLALAALNEGVISPEKEILSTGSLKIPNPYAPGQYTVFNDWKAHGWVDMRRAIAVSSNVYFFEVGGGFGNQKGLGITNIEKYARLFGLGEVAGIDILGETEGVIPNPEWKKKNFEDGVWRIGDTYNTSIGQYGFQVTPLQMARALSVVANGGVFAEPHLVLGSEKKDAEKVDMPAEYFKIVREGMRLGATEGTGTGLNVPYVKVATKTGTAELGAGKKYVNSWAMGFFPYENPEYVFVVAMEKGPRGNLIGGVAVMRQLLDWMHFNTPEYLSASPSPEGGHVVPVGSELPTQPDEVGD